MIGLNTNITERKSLEEQLRQAQILESVGQLAGGVAHDFNNILAATMMHLGFLQENENLDQATHESLKELMVEAKRAANLTRQLLMFSRRSVLEIKVLDLNELRGHETILVVEDEASLRRVATQGLQRFGYRVLEAGNGREAMKLWQENAGQIDLLFSDMVMPEGMTGLDLAEKLKEKKPALKVIISSGYSTEMIAQGQPNAEGVMYLPKPYTAEVLSKAIRDCLDRA